MFRCKPFSSHLRVPFFDPKPLVYGTNDWNEMRGAGHAHDVPGISETFANGIDGTNIVGNCYDGSYHGFSYDGSTYTHFDMPVASSTYAYGMDGTNIVGSFQDGSGNVYGFLAVIPEPTTLSLLAAGMLMACRRRLLRCV